MPDAALYAVGSAVLVSLVSLVGIAAIWANHAQLRGVLFVFVSLATGALFGDALVHLLPEAFAKSGRPEMTSFYVLAGIFAFFVLEKLLRWRHSHLLEGDQLIHPVGVMNLVADAIHNLVDGTLIGASYLAGLPVGIATTVAVVLHEVPQEIGDFAVLLHAGFTRSQALLFNLLSASLAIVGALAATIVGLDDAGPLTSAVLPLTAGMFIYIGGADLIPELHKEPEAVKSLVQLIAMGAGVGIMFLLLLLD